MIKYIETNFATNCIETNLTTNYIETNLAIKYIEINLVTILYRNQFSNHVI